MDIIKMKESYVFQSMIKIKYREDLIRFSFRILTFLRISSYVYLFIGINIGICFYTEWIAIF